MTTSKGRRRIAGRRGDSGLIAVVMVVALVVIALIGGALLRVAAARRAQVRMEERRLQADWLAESGLERASARLAGDAGYLGETWQVPPAELGGPWGATVSIAVEAVPDRPDRRLVRVRAEYPREAQRRARRTVQAIMRRDPEPWGGGR